MGRFGLLVGLYSGLSAFYFFATDSVWETLRTHVPDFAIALMFAFMGPIVTMDFIQPVSVVPYAAQSSLAVALFWLYGQSMKARYVAALGALWIFALQSHSYIMGRLSDSPNPVPCEEMCSAFMQYIF